MGESNIHMDLVRLLRRYVINSNKISCKLILSDLPEEIEKPIAMPEGFRPDLYYKDSHCLIIGEAKTSLDFKKKHSINQYMSYLKYCSIYSSNSKFYLAVPWDVFISAKNLLRKIKKQNNYLFEIYVLNDINCVEKI
ncbi:hypothetical protein [Clostridium butyricum]|uniref:hypothetical protein n=1 Tax=Clostridium butyricum TaxID=1492 RepID=UPI00374FB1F6